MRKAIALPIVTLLATLIAFLGGCAPSPTATSVPARVSASPTPTLMRPMQGPQQATPQPTNTKPPVPPKAGAEALEFRLKDLQGREVSLGSLRGKKVMVNFWATWCGPCQTEIPSMVKLYDEFRLRGFEVLAVNLREDPTKVAQFVKRFDMRFPVLLDRGGIVSMNYFVRGIPTSVFVDEKGVIQYVHVGTMSESVMREYVVGLLE